MNAEQAEKLAAARLLVVREQPYLAVALYAMPVVERAGLGTFAVDECWRLYVDPGMVDAWSVAEVAAVLQHEVWHLLHDHAARREALGVAADERLRWNVACDAEINDDLADAGVTLPGTPVTPARLGQPAHQLAETYFAHISTAREPERDCGSGADGETRPYDERDPGTDMSRSQGELIRRQTAQEIAEAARRGSVPAAVRRWAQGVLEPKIDWRTVLAASVRAGLAHAAGNVDHTYARPSRRGAALRHRVVLPAMRRPQLRVAIVVDTSASMDTALLAQALAEVDGALRSAAIAGRNVTVLTCDSDVHSVARVRAADSVVLDGGGGTDMGAGLARAVALRPRPDVVVVLTDGFTPWPQTAPAGVRVVVGLLAPEGTAPSWAMVVRCA